jgi:hypothetical protein
MDIEAQAALIKEVSALTSTEDAEDLKVLVLESLGPDREYISSRDPVRHFDPVTTAVVVSIVWPFVQGAARQFMNRVGERAGDTAFATVEKLFSSGDDIDVEKTPPEQVLRAAMLPARIC